MRGGPSKRARAQLAQVALHRLGAFGTVAGGRHHQRRAEREDRVAHPSHRQVAEPVVAARHRLDAGEALRGGDHVGVAQQHALGAPGGAGGVGDQRHVLRAALLDLALEVARMLLGKVAAGLLQVGERPEDVVGVRAHAERILVDDEAQVLQLAGQGQHLVDLLLVFGHDDRHLGVVEHEGQLAGNGVLVERHGHAAERLRGELRPVEARPVVAEHRQLVAALEACRRQAQREVVHVGVAVAPGVGLPDAAVLLAHAGLPRVALHVARQQLGQRIGGGVGEEAHAVRLPWLVPR